MATLIWEVPLGPVLLLGKTLRCIYVRSQYSMLYSPLWSHFGYFTIFKSIPYLLENNKDCALLNYLMTWDICLNKFRMTSNRSPYKCTRESATNTSKFNNIRENSIFIRACLSRAEKVVWRKNEKSHDTVSLIVAASRSLTNLQVGSYYSYDSN